MCLTQAGQWKGNKGSVAWAAEWKGSKGTVSDAGSSVEGKQKQCV